MSFRRIRVPVFANYFLPFASFAILSPYLQLYLRETFPGCGMSLLWAIGPLAEIATIWFAGPMIARWGLRVFGAAGT